MRVSICTLFFGGMAAVLAGCGAEGGGGDDATPGGRRGGGERRIGEAGAAAPPATRWLVDVAAESGLDFVHESGARGNLDLQEIMGGGAALLDGDGDGDLDVYLTNGHGALPERRPSSGATNRYYRQDDGHFVEATSESGLGDGGYGMGLAVGDLDNDGDVDVYLANDGPDRLYLNDGRGHFTDVTEQAGIAVDGWSSSAACVDYDRDGLLDVYVVRYVDVTEARGCTDRAGRPSYCNPNTYRALPDVLLRNLGGGRFEDVSDAAGLRSVPPGAGLGVVCADLDDDGWQDVYVANDGDPNQLWRNRGDGTFTDAALFMGVACNGSGASEAGMGVLAGDLDNDADLDLFMTHLDDETNTCYGNLGGGLGFDDVSARSGLGLPSLSFTGFGTAAVDLELDGDLDLLVVNGRVSRAEPREDSWAAAPWDEYAEPNTLYLNDGAAGFAPVADAFGAAVEISRGMAVGDVDRDGDLDVLVSNVAGPVRLYRNEAPRSGRWLMVRAVDPRLRRDAYGARVTVRVDGRDLVRRVGAASSYMSSGEPLAHFGLGRPGVVEHVTLRWPDGLRERFRVDGVDRRVELERGTGEALP